MTATSRIFFFGLCLAIPMFSRGTTLYVNLHNPTPPDPYQGFGDWATAATNIQDAVDAASSGDTILVAPGVYRVTESGGSVVQITGGLIPANGSLTLRAALPPGAEPKPVVIDGQNVNRGVSVNLNNATSGERFLTIDGFDIINGHTSESGGGIRLFDDAASRRLTLQLLNCRLTNNTAVLNGGGVYGYNTSSSHPTTVVFSNSVVAGNKVLNTSGTAERKGGGIDLRSFGEVRLVNTTIRDNVVQSGVSSNLKGGGIYVRDGALVATNSILLANQVAATSSANTGGAGFYGENISALRLVNCLVANNDASIGSAVNIQGSTFKAVTLLNCTLSGNTRPDSDLDWRAAFYIRHQNGSLQVLNTIFYDNPVDSSFRSISGSSTNFDPYEVRFSRINPEDVVTFPCASNLTGPPMFIGGGDFGLRSDSPCIDAGTNQAWMADAVDLAQRPRLDGIHMQKSTWGPTNTTIKGQRFWCDDAAIRLFSFDPLALRVVGNHCPAQIGGGGAGGGRRGPHADCHC